ncbi:MAG: nuoM 1, partial [Phycisphaerales bacterium]|nr:nuoM 1 [Phycisphaerales bacterium]
GGRSFGAGVSFASLVAVLAMAGRYDWAVGGYQFVAWGPRLSGLGAQFAVGVDQLSLTLVVLTAALHALAVAGSLWSVRVRTREYYAWMSFLLVTMLGVFMATDLLLFYTFFEVSLVPLFFLVGIWGGPDRRRAANTLFLYTFAASIFALAGIIYLGVKAGSFDITQVIRFAQDPAKLGPDAKFWILMSLLAAFVVKTPLFPLHTWLPLAHTEAPSGGAADLAGLVLKLGAYGLLRIALPIGLVGADGQVLFPRVLTVLAVMCLAGIVYAALVAWVQHDAKRLVAYSSVSHMGFCILGMLALNPVGMGGSVLYMVNHGIVSGALFLVIGMVYARYGTRDLRDLGGLARAMPKMAFFLFLFTFAAVGLPLTNGFVSEFLTIQGAFTSKHLGPAFAAVAATGVVLGAVYMLHMAGSLLYGPLKVPAAGAEVGGDDSSASPAIEDVTAPTARGDLTRREVFVLTPLAVAVIVLGVYPTPLLRALERPLAQIRNPNAAAAMAATPAPPPAAGQPVVAAR